jgi:hypothetical protein
VEVSLAFARSLLEQEGLWLGAVLLALLLQDIPVKGGVVYEAPPGLLLPSCWLLRQQEWRTDQNLIWLVGMMKLAWHRHQLEQLGNGLAHALQQFALVSTSCIEWPSVDPRGSLGPFPTS